ncbi:MAG: hypothetical protein AAF662_02340 [Pseudomonadota bacterium]
MTSDRLLNDESRKVLNKAYEAIQGVEDVVVAQEKLGAELLLSLPDDRIVLDTGLSREDVELLENARSNLARLLNGFRKSIR